MSKKSSLPSRLSDYELEVYGFTKTVCNTDSTIRSIHHNKYESYRHKCDGCGYWVKQLKSAVIRGVEGVFCKKCRGYAIRRKVRRYRPFFSPEI